MPCCRRALDETVEYITSDMSEALIRKDAFEVLTFASKRGHPRRVVPRVRGALGRHDQPHRATLPRQTVHGFDSFEGLPAPWSGYTLDAGAFSGEGTPDGRRQRRTARRMVRRHVAGLSRIARRRRRLRPHRLRHLQLGKDDPRQLAPRVRPGTIIVFNEYFNYPNWKQHEFRAFQEFCTANRVEYRYLCWAMYEVAVEIMAIGRPRRGPVDAVIRSPNGPAPPGANGLDVLAVEHLVRRPEEARVQLVDRSGAEAERNADVRLERLDLVRPEGGMNRTSPASSCASKPWARANLGNPAGSASPERPGNMLHRSLAANGDVK